MTPPPKVLIASTRTFAYYYPGGAPKQCTFSESTSGEGKKVPASVAELGLAVDTALRVEKVEPDGPAASAWQVERRAARARHRNNIIRRCASHEDTALPLARHDEQPTASRAQVEVGWQVQSVNDQPVTGEADFAKKVRTGHMHTRAAHFRAAGDGRIWSV